jgi:hypothetical protein
VDTYAANTTTSWFHPPRQTRHHRLQNVKFSISKKLLLANKLMMIGLESKSDLLVAGLFKMKE